MIRISYDDFKKLATLLEKEGQGAPLTFREDGATLKVSTLDRGGKDMVVELSDVRYPMLPRVTKTETI